jgi:hypothetical protein
VARPANWNPGVPLRVRSDAKCFYVEWLYSQQLLVNKAIKMMIGIGTPMIQSNIERIRDSSVICRIMARIMMVARRRLRLPGTQLLRTPVSTTL